MKVIYDLRVDKIIQFLSIRSKEDHARIAQVVDLLIEKEFHLNALYLKKLTKLIWELRAGRYRLLFGINDSTIIITHIFLKKTQKTPKQEIKLAIQRLKQYEK